MKKAPKNCSCCGRKLKISFGATKYCNNCSYHVNNLVKKMHYYKNKARLSVLLQQETKRLRLLLKIKKEKK